MLSIASYTLGDGARRFDPIYSDQSLQGRFNAPDASYGLLYAAKAEPGAFVERFLRSPGRRDIDPGLLDNKGYPRLKVLRPLRVVEFDGRRLAPLGATAAVPHGDPPYDIPQTWSRALRDHPAKSPTRRAMTLPSSAMRCSTAPIRQSGSFGAITIGSGEWRTSTRLV
ncbi:RES domain-containing protein [Phenylobacterium sp.]|uniref:RES domain-containing protein n=1 Tax=Phenylobacterium sp. TaxID=1871053 RepID=UPI0034462B1B